jgi:hypothetical protein
MFRFFINYFSFHQVSNEVVERSSKIIFGKVSRCSRLAACRAEAPAKVGVEALSAGHGGTAPWLQHEVFTLV